MIKILICQALAASETNTYDACNYRKGRMRAGGVVIATAIHANDQTTQGWVAFCTP